MDNFKIATFNVNSVRSRLPILERWLAGNRVDCLCLQETKVEDGSFPTSFFEDLGFHVRFSGEKSYNGVAIVSTIPPDEHGFGLGDGEEPSGRTRVAWCRFGGLRVVNAYVPQGKAIDNPDYPMKLRFFERLEDFLRSKGVPKEGLALVGDLNVAPTEIDVTNPKNKKNHVCFHEDVRKAFRSLCSMGLVDVFRKHRPGEGEYSFWDYRVPNSLERNIGWRIDHILATGPLAERSVDSYSDREPRAWERPSDHTVVVAEFRS